MALFKKDDNTSRAVEIIKGIKPKSSQDPNNPPADPPVYPPVYPPVDPQNPPVDPPVDPQPPADPPVDPQDPPTDPPADPQNPPQDPPVDPQDPPADPPPSDPQHNEPSDPPSDPPVNPPTAELSEENVFNFLSERLNKPINSLDDLTPTIPELDPELQQLKDWKEKTGLSLTDFATYNRDFSQMSDLDVVREIRSQQYSNLSGEELDFLMEDVTFNSEKDDERAQMAKSVKLKTEAADGRRKLEANKLDLKPNTALTQQQQEDIALAQQVREQQQAQQTNADAYAKNLEKAALSLSAVNMQLSDDLNINYDVPEGDRKTLPELVNKMPHWYNKDGSINHEAIVKDALIIREYPNMIKKAYEQGVSIGIENKIRKDKNIPTDPGKEPVGGKGTPKKGNINDVVDGITGGNNKRQKRFKFTPPQK